MTEKNDATFKQVQASAIDAGRRYLAADSAFARDGLKSTLGSLGDPNRDKASSVYFSNEIISDEQLIAAFEGNWIANKIVAIPAQDALRKWRRFEGDKSADMKLEEDRLKLSAKVFEALWKGRLYGGAAIYIGTEQKPEEPLDLKKIQKGGLKYLTVLSRLNNEIQAGELVQDPLSEQYGKPKNYTVSGANGSVEIHPSRLAIFTGSDRADTWISATGAQGWGNSVLQSVHDTVAQSGGVFASVASLVFEANVDVIGIPDLMENIGTSDYESALIKRFQLAMANKSINGSLMLDAGETYDRKTASFAQLPEIMQAFAMFCSAAADIPATRFLAQSPTGLNSSGESDMDNYHDMIQSMQSIKIGPAIALLDQCLMRSATGVGGQVFAWNPLKQMDEIEQAKIQESKFKAVQAMDSGLLAIETIYQQQKNMGLFDGTKIDSLEEFKKTIEEQNAEVA